MEGGIELRIAAAILNFLEQQEFTKAAKAIRKEAAKREWDIDTAAAAADSFDLLQLCTAAAAAEGKTNLN
ncbi:nucleolar phosphoprotein p130, putative [Eimeria maxima]|uniref:Nucleolar phosphoprotein p130, putative n=1 Tax=Eimeria maxima TaxID=5804 RepID=U6M1M3_EIMMA|nr:nucleolar phosphoprotein p130, putative [Eimeria maxima]CDJ56359.1 nucleolar phosphoprotein p130, putative [Eimeria maxima]